MIAHHRGDQLSFSLVRKPGQPNQQDTSVNLLAAEYEFTEILIRRHKQCPHVVGYAQDHIVRNAWIHLGHIYNLVTVLPELVYDLPVNALVDQKVHATFCGNG